MNVQEMLKGAQEAMTVQRVYGEAFEREGSTFIPVAEVRGGGGGGSDDAGNGGGGFGAMASPAGMYVIRNGDAVWKPAVNVNRVVMGAQIVAIVALLAIRTILKSRK
ncbi:MAG TPA: sporulation protein [Candidatus Limnocylindria bacterium]|nr:sporulation protein [Candidatus Limnocylindria bacterium]